ncbi:MAG: hypothetical protein GX053_00385 [Tissierella sp.]|nr:hypothetical protein [Tissierella sp.]
MKNSDMDNINKLIARSFLSSSVQCIICAPIVSIYMVLLSRRINALWGVIMIYLILPIFSVFSAYGCYILVRRGNSQSDEQNRISKVTVYRLRIRLLSVFVFILIGVIMGVRGVMPSSIVNFIIWGESVGIIEPYLLINIFFYFLVAIFPTAYAIFEYRLLT